MILLNKQGKITVADDKTNIAHIFNVPQGIKALKINYSYSPKLFEDEKAAKQVIKDCLEKYGEDIPDNLRSLLPVKNLVTLSLDGCGRYIGAAHRQAQVQEHIIGPDFSSVGFEKTQITAGEWQIMLNVHSVSCDVEYHLTVEGVEI